MAHPPQKTLRIGDWLVNPLAGVLSRGEERVRLEARTMRLLLCLAERPGEVVSIDTLLSQVWSGVVVTPDSVYQAVAGLRRLLGDDAKQPAYIVTVPRLGYRLVAPVDTQLDAPAVASTGRTRSRMYAAIVAVVLGIGSLTYYFVPVRETRTA
jgi:transcriptional activator of cad operon